MMEQHSSNSDLENSIRVPTTPTYLPPIYTTEYFQKLDLPSRVQLLFKYHEMHLQRLYDWRRQHYSNKSKNDEVYHHSTFIKNDDILQANTTFISEENLIDNKEEKDEENAIEELKLSLNENVQETTAKLYTIEKKNVTKRKLYSETTEVFPNKKTKNMNDSMQPDIIELIHGNDSFIKKSAIAQKRKLGLTRKLENDQCQTNTNSFTEEYTIEDIEENEVQTIKQSKLSTDENLEEATKVVPKKRTGQNKRCTDVQHTTYSTPPIEIEKFKFKSVKYPTRADKLFEALKQQTENAKENESQRFQRTLQQLDDDDEDEVEDSSAGENKKDVSDSPEEEAPFRRRIVPPNPYKKKLALKRNSQTKDETQIPTTSFYGKNKTAETLQDSEEHEGSPISFRFGPLDVHVTPKMPQSRRPIREEKVQQDCPICGEKFDSDVIEGHASTCGDFDNV